MEQKSVAEWRKLLTLSYGQFGITIKGFKGDVTELDIPEVIGNQQVVAIGAYAFNCCRSLSAITIPATIKKIDCSAFLSCTNLSSVTIRNENADIAPDAFRGCPNLADKQGFAAVKGVLYGYYGMEVHVKIPDTILSLTSTAFIGNKTIRSIILPESISIIPTYGFSSCEELERIYIPATVTRICDGAFYHCKKLTIETPVGSTAHQYATDNNISFKTI